jgi:hypothetical protein
MNRTVKLKENAVREEVELAKELLPQHLVEGEAKNLEEDEKVLNKKEKPMSDGPIYRSGWHETYG